MATVVVIGVGAVFLVGMVAGTTMQTRHLRVLVRRLARERREAAEDAPGDRRRRA